MAVILNVDADHLDFFKDLADVEHSFHRFAALVPENGSIIVNADDAGSMASVQGLTHPVTTFFGLDAPEADITAENITLQNGCPAFDIVCRGEHYCRASLRVPGRQHPQRSGRRRCGKGPEIRVQPWNTAWPHSPAQAAVSSTRAITTVQKFMTITPTIGELHALLTTAKTLGYRRILCAFQPHTYSRTKALFRNSWKS